VRGENTVKATG